MASTKISAMSAATNLTGAVVPIVQEGANKKASESLFLKTSGAHTLGAAVTAAYNGHSFQFTGATANSYALFSDLEIDFQAHDTAEGGKTSEIYITPEEIDILAEDRLFIGVFTGGNPNFQGAVYNDDYSSDYVNRSLVDKEYVDTAVSDVRLKENIVDVDSSLAKINSLRPVEFDMKKDGEHKAGFIAQELREVFPDMIVEGEYLKIKKDQLIPYMVKAIQELSKEIELLKNA
jgi:hypothetical protein